MSGSMKMRTSDFDYRLPEELIAQRPPARRGDSRMLVLDISTGAIEVSPFSDLPSFLRRGDCIVINDTRVIKARLYARKDSGASVEALLLRQDAAAPRVWSCLLRPAKRVSPGTALRLLDAKGLPSGRTLRLVSKSPDGECVVEFGQDDVAAALEECGHVPLPPYIRREDVADDAGRYQTVFAKSFGAVAAPTAGLHFTPDIFERLQSAGVSIAELTLHVGAGTFKPVSAENVEDHKMHSEDFILPDATASLLNRTRRDGGRILAVGTTSLRVLESCVGADRLFTPRSGSTDIFIRPPARPVSADMLLTNFHLPKSTLLMLVCAFAGMERTMAAYEFAVKERLRFFSYGDCMLLK